MSGRVWIGLFLIVFGVGFLLHQANVWDFTAILATWWPLIIIMIGFIQLINFSYSNFSGFLFITIGGLLLINQWVDVNLSAYIWPLILIFVGLAFMFSRFNYEKELHSDETIHTFSVFSGADVRCQTNDFKGGNVTAIFGGAEIDLRDIAISKEGAVLDLLAVFGGMTITVPENVKVQVSGIPIFGGWENKVRKRISDQRDKDIQVLRVNCLTAFGGVEIRD